MKKILLLVLPVLAAAGLFGSVTAAHATPVSRANAVAKAHEYLQSEAFSFKGLVGQLKYEGFSTSDATYGVSHSGANWTKEAAAKAKEYLQSEAFSRQRPGRAARVRGVHALAGAVRRTSRRTVDRNATRRTTAAPQAAQPGGC